MLMENNLGQDPEFRPAWMVLYIPESCHFQEKVNLLHRRCLIGSPRTAAGATGVVVLKHSEKREENNG
jgi:hypothetical protein